jgi:tetratricopeptide (TPR) repeat protein
VNPARLTEPHVREVQGSITDDATVHKLTTPDLADVPSELVPFAIRGAAIAQLGLICLSKGVAEELAGEQYFYPLGELIYTYLNTRQFMRRHATAILAHPSYSELRALLFKAVREGEPVSINPLQQTLVQSVFRSVVLSLEMLTTLAHTMPNPMLLLNHLPRDWRALHMASELLDSGRREQSLIQFTETLCEEVRHGWTTMQAGAEREKCLAQLAALKSDQHVALEEHRAIIDDHFFQVTGKMRGLASLIDAHPEDTLILLDNGIEDSSDQASLFYLKEETRYWAALLLGRLYARMFDSRMIRPKEAAEWCELVLAAVRGLPISIHKDEYQNVYTCIQSWLEGFTEPPKPLPQRDKSMLGDSHVLATSILTMGYEAISQRKSSVDLDEVLSDRRGWNEGEFVFEDGTISRSSWSYINYVFPAVRLALIAVGQAFSLEDPAGRLLSERKSTHDLLSRHQNIFRGHPNNDPDDYYTRGLEKANSEFQQRLKLTPRDETLLLWCGDALLRAGRFQEAAKILRRCLALPSCGPHTKASALYNLACVNARLGLESECRTLLEERAQVKPLDKEHMTTDPDFETLRDRSWFRDMIASN